MTKRKPKPLTDLVKKYGRLFPEVLKEAVQPVYNFDIDSVFDTEQLEYLSNLGKEMPLKIYADGKLITWRGPLPGQKHMIAGIMAALREDNTRLILRGETGVGKTQIALMSLAMARREKMNVGPVIITEPRRVTRQWRERIIKIVPDAITMPLSTPAQVEMFAALARIYRDRKMMFGMIPNSMISRGPGYRAAYRMVGLGDTKDINGHWKSKSPFAANQILVGCPQCGFPFLKVDIPGTHRLEETLNLPIDLERILDRGVKVFCPRCKGAMFENVKPVPPGKDTSERNVQFDVGDYLFRNYKRLSVLAKGPIYNTLIIDELHKVFHEGSIRGETVMNLSTRAKYLFGLGASIYSGKASSIMWLYLMFFPHKWPEWGDLETARQRWMDEFSNIAVITKEKYYPSTSGGGSQGSKLKVKPIKTKRELPSAPPRLVRELAPRIIHAKLNHLGIQMPELQVRGIQVDLDQDHLDAYKELVEHAYKMARRGTGSTASQYLQAALIYPIAPWQEVWVDEYEAKQYPANYECAPERALIKFCKEEKDKGRKTIVYVTHTEIRDIVERLIDRLDAHGMSAIRLPKSMNRELIPSWLRHEAPKYDICILNQKAVEGVDAIKFQNTYFYQVDYSVWPVQQAAGRVWRLGQTEACQTIFPEIKNTILHRVLGLVMQSLASASQIYGDEIDAHIGKYSKGSLLMEALRQELAGSALPDYDKLYAKAQEVITQGVSTNGNGDDENDDFDIAEEHPGITVSSSGS